MKREKSKNKLRYIASRFLLLLLFLSVGGIIHPQKAAAVQNYYLNATTGTTDDCLSGGNTVRDLSGTSGGSNQSINQMNGNVYEWNVTETARTIQAGTWSVNWYNTHDNGGGNKNITVVLARYNSSCTHQEDIINTTVQPTKGASNESLSVSATPSAITFSSGDILVLTFQSATANMNTLQYGNNTGNYNSYIQFPDESVAGFTVAGNIYEDEATTALTACDGTTANVAVSINGGTPTTGTCADADGAFSIDTGAAEPSAGTPITIWIDGTTCNATNTNPCGTTVLRYVGSGNISDAIVRRSRLILRSDDGSAVTGANVGVYDTVDDGDIVFDVDASNNLTVEDQIKLIINSGDGFTPGATVTTSPSSSSGSTDGDLLIESSATLTMAANALSIGGDFTNSGTYSASAGQNTTFTATATGHSIDLGTGNLQNVIFSGSSGGWSFSDANNTITGDITMTNGTLSGSNSITVNGGDISGTSGTVTITGGTFLLSGAGSIGANTNWTFSNLTLQGSSQATSGTGSGTLTVSGVLKVDDSHTFSDGGKTFILSGSGAPFIMTSTATLSASSGTIRYTGTSATTIATTTYPILEFMPTSGSPSYTIGNASSQAISATSMTVGDGSNAVNVYASSYSPDLDINGDVTIDVSGYFEAPSSGSDFFVNGSWTQNGTYYHNYGTVTFDSSVLGETIDGELNDHGQFFLVTLNNVDGGWSFATSTNILNGLSVTAGLLTGTNDITVGGDPGELLSPYISGNGTITLTGGTVTLTEAVSGSISIGGTTDWTFNNLTLSGAGGTTFDDTGSSSVTVSSVLTIDTPVSATLDTKTWILSGSGTPFVVSGAVALSGGAFQYTSTAATNITAEKYTTLTLAPSGAGSPTYTLGSGTFTISTNLVLGDGTNAVDVSTSTNSPTVDVTGDLMVNSNATLSGTGSGTITINGGDVTGNGTISLDAGTFLLDGAGTFGGDTAWNFNNLTFGDGSGSTTTTAEGSGGVTASSTLAIADNQTLDADGKTWTLTNAGTPFSIAGTATFTTSTSTISYVTEDTTGTNITATTYYNLTLNKSGNTFTGPAATLDVDNDLNITAGTFDIDTNDTTLTVTGTLTNSDTLSASDTNALTIVSAFVNNGTFTNNSGEVVAAPTSTVSFTGSSNIVFYDFTDTTAGTTVQFENDAGGEYTQFQGTVTIQGTSTSPIVISSTSAGNRWNIYLTGTQDILWTHIKDSGCQSGTNTLDLDPSNVDYGNNDFSCWQIRLRGSGSFGAVGSGSGGGSPVGGGTEGGGAGGSSGNGSGGGGGQTGGDEGSGSGGGGAAP